MLFVDRDLAYLFCVVLLAHLSPGVCASLETKDRYNVNESAKSILEKNETLTVKDHSLASSSSSAENQPLEEDVGQVNFYFRISWSLIVQFYRAFSETNLKRLITVIRMLVKKEIPKTLLMPSCLLLSLKVITIDRKLFRSFQVLSTTGELMGISIEDFKFRKTFSCPKIKSDFVTGKSTADLSPEGCLFS